MEKNEALHHIRMLETIKEELYSYIIKESVDKYYLQTLNICEELLKQNINNDNRSLQKSI